MRDNQETTFWATCIFLSFRIHGKGHYMLFLVAQRQKKRLSMETNFHCYFVRSSQSYLAFRQSICGLSYP